MPYLVTIYDVAEAAGVSASTVSHVLNKTRRVSEVTRRRVETAIDKLGYKQNDAARALRDGKAKLVGLILPDISNSFFSDIAHRVELLAYERDMRVITCNSDYDRKREIAYIDDFVRRRIDGLIIAPTIPDADLDTTLLAAGLPAVLIDRVPAKGVLPSVAIDNWAAATLAAEHLYGLGHRRIGCISAHPGLVESVDKRTRGFVESLQVLSGETKPGPIAYSDFRLSGGFYAATSLLEEHDDLTALFCANDVMALGAIRAATSSGRRVPEDISVMGFDDSSEARVTQPSLTSVAQPLAEMATAAMNLLRDGGDARIVLSARLVVRESTRRPAPSRPPQIVKIPRPRTPSAALRSLILAGSGPRAQRFAMAVTETGGVALTGIFDPSAAYPYDLAGEIGTRPLSRVEALRALDEVDALLVADDTPQCLGLIEEALRRHVHVLCLPSPEALEIFKRAAPEAIVQVASRLRFDPAVGRIADLVETGSVGHLLHVQLTRRGPAVADESAGIELEDLDILRFIVGQEGTEIAAFQHALDGETEAAAARAEVITIRFTSGVIATLESLYGPTVPSCERLAVVGANGSLEAVIGSGPPIVHQGAELPGPRPGAGRDTLPEERELAAFAAAIAGRSRRGGGVPDLASAVRLSQAVSQSLKLGQIVRTNSTAVPKARDLPKISKIK